MKIQEVLHQQGLAEGESIQDKLYRRHQELRKKSGLPDPEYYQELKASYDLPDEERLARVKEIKKKYNVNEGVPQPGPSSGAPKQFGSDAKIQTRQMTAKDIISSVPGVPYYNNVVDDYDAKDYSWGVTKKVIEYATYLKDHPESLEKLPPILVLNGKFEDGAHRLSAIWLLQQRMDPKNPLWTSAKLNVQFIKTGVTEGHELCPVCGGAAYSDQMLAEKQDACYHKVKSRYKVWPSAYASGALVRCRKVGAKNWGNKSKK